MSDLIPGGGNNTPTNVLAKQGVTAIGGIVGGTVLMIMRALPWPLGIAAGVIVGVVGIGGILSKDPDDRKPGILAAAAGALSILARIGIIRPLAGTLLSISALGLLALGVWNGIKFIKGLKSRS
ncbi:hypothetical protein FACS189445_2700 [Spirochaetia bacterium]|nr:hypothetical protein FACS189445_2700 [Spirochaetia bacterium]